MPNWNARVLLTEDAAIVLSAKRIPRRTSRSEPDGSAGVDRWTVRERLERLGLRKTEAK
jgi:hypothetical protein